MPLAALDPAGQQRAGGEHVGDQVDPPLAVPVLERSSGPVPVARPALANHMSIGPTEDSTSPTSASVAASSQTSSSRARTTSGPSSSLSARTPCAVEVGGHDRARPARDQAAHERAADAAGRARDDHVPTLGVHRPTPYSARAIRGSAATGGAAISDQAYEGERPRDLQTSRKEADGDYTITNLKQDSRTPPARDRPYVEGRFARKHLDSRELGVSYFRYAPGFRSPVGHRHREQEEVYVVLSGSGRVKLDDEIRDLGPWDVVRVAPPVGRAFEAGRGRASR